MTIKQPKIIALQPKKTVKPVSAQEMEQLTQSMAGMNLVNSVNPEGPNVDVSVLLKQKVDESDEQFAIRSDLTYKIFDLPDYKVNSVTCVTLGNMLMSKSVLGMTYEPDIEQALEYILSLLSN